MELVLTKEEVKCLKEMLENYEYSWSEGAKALSNKLNEIFKEESNGVKSN